MTGEDLQIFVETSIACKEALARAKRADAALAAVPWQALLNIYECLTLPAVALDADVDRLASFLNQYAPWVPNESEERDDMEPPNRDFTTTGDFRRARGVIPWQPGDEPAEITIRRLRDAPEHAERVELGPITQESLLPDVMPPLGRRTIEIMERKIAPSDNESEG